MFKKLVAIEPVSLIPSAQEELKQYAEEVVLYEDIPQHEDEIVKRDILESLKEVKEHLEGRIDLPNARDLVF